MVSGECTDAFSLRTKLFPSNGESHSSFKCWETATSLSQARNFLHLCGFYLFCLTTANLRSFQILSENFNPISASVYFAIWLQQTFKLLPDCAVLWLKQVFYKPGFYLWKRVPGEEELNFSLLDLKGIFYIQQCFIVWQKLDKVSTVSIYSSWMWPEFIWYQSP